MPAIMSPALSAEDAAARISAPIEEKEILVCFALCPVEDMKHEFGRSLEENAGYIACLAIRLLSLGRV